MRKKKDPAVGIPVGMEPQTATLPHNHLERLDVTRLSEYSEDLVARHRWRYEWAVKKILARGTADVMMDFGCAMGFGTKILLKATRNIIGVDINSDAIRKAARYCRSGCAQFHLGGEGTFPDPRLIIGRKFDAVVCLEVIEHLHDPAGFLKRARRFSNSQTGHLYLSTQERPEGVNPDAKPMNEFHVREYTHGELREIVQKTGWKVVSTDTKSLPGFILLEAAAAEVAK